MAAGDWWTPPREHPLCLGLMVPKDATPRGTRCKSSANESVAPDKKTSKAAVADRSGREPGNRNLYVAVLETTVLPIHQSPKNAYLQATLVLQERSPEGRV